jgi:transketolase
MTIDELKAKANYIRDEVIRVACKNKCGHIAPSLSTVDLLVALYYQIMSPFGVPNFANPNYPYTWANRDRLILSKGHGCYALYAILADLGIIPKEQWERFGDNMHPPCDLKGCVEYHPSWGLEASSGSLGHGLPMAVGMAYAAKLQKLPWHTYCIVGDGELQEGSCWEALNFMYEHDLRNITVIVDANGYMALGKVVNLIQYTDFYEGLVDGHDIWALIWILKQRPRTLVARTVKGYGLKCMENKAHFHYRVPTEQELCEGRTYGQE